jgi:hypothetical protein
LHEFFHNDAQRCATYLLAAFNGAVAGAIHQAFASSRKDILEIDVVIERGISRLKQRDAGIRRQTIEKIRTRLCDSGPGRFLPGNQRKR